MAQAIIEMGVKMTTENDSTKEQARIAKIARSLVELLNQEGNNYQVDFWPEHYKPEESGTSDVFVVEWGTPGRRVKRLVKINKPAELLTTPRQIRHVVERGYDTGNELKISLTLDHPGAVGLVDYFDKETADKYGLLGPVVVQDFFSDSQSLEEIVRTQDYSSAKGIFKRAKEYFFGNTSKRKQDKDINDILFQTAKTLRDVHTGVGVRGEVPLFHRDLKPSNILVRREKGRLTAKIADWANASPADSQKQSYLPTMGGHVVSDPLLMGVFTGEERCYDFNSDIYALMSSIVFYARGKPIVDYNPDTGEAKAVDTWASLLDSNGKLDKEKHRAAVRQGVKALPKNLRPIAEKALSLYENERYHSTQEFLNDVERAVSNPYSTLKKVGVGLAAIGLITGGLAGYSYFHDVKKDLETKVQKAHVAAEFKKRFKAIDAWYQARVYINQRKDPENKNQIYFSQDSDDMFESNELEGWMDLLHPYDYKENRHYGDSKTAIAAYLDSTLDKFPTSVFEALMRVNKISDPKELVERLKKEDRTLKLGFNELEDALKTIDEDLYYKVHFLDYRVGDNITRMIASDRRRGVAVKWECASEVYELKQKRDAELKEAYEKTRQENRNRGYPTSGIIGDANKLRIDSEMQRGIDEINKKYDEKIRIIQKSHFPVYSK